MVSMLQDLQHFNNMLMKIEPAAAGVAVPTAVTGAVPTTVAPSAPTAIPVAAATGPTVSTNPNVSTNLNVSTDPNVTTHPNATVTSPVTSVPIAVPKKSWFEKCRFNLAAY